MKFKKIIPVFVLINLLCLSLGILIGYEVGVDIAKKHYDPIIENKEYCNIMMKQNFSYEDYIMVKNEDFIKKIEAILNGTE